MQRIIFWPDKNATFLGFQVCQKKFFKNKIEYVDQIIKNEQKVKCKILLEFNKKREFKCKIAAKIQFLRFDEEICGHCI